VGDDSGGSRRREGGDEEGELLGTPAGQLSVGRTHRGVHVHSPREVHDCDLVTAGREHGLQRCTGEQIRTELPAAVQRAL
jgi:hypothetical protein